VAGDREQITVGIPDRVPPPQYASAPSLIPAARHPESRLARPPVADHARTVAPQRLDSFGRAAPVRNAEEKVLDIPVFLNRKAN
jgi:hypothetical protein